jgi:magnesium-transporting ATPase (P-type)
VNKSLEEAVELNKLPERMKFEIKEIYELQIEGIEQKIREQLWKRQWEWLIFALFCLSVGIVIAVIALLSWIIKKCKSSGREKEVQEEEVEEGTNEKPGVGKSKKE